MDGAGLFGGGWVTTAVIEDVFCSSCSCWEIEVDVDCIEVAVDVCLTSQVSCCFECLAIKAWADSEKCMLLALFSTATLTTLTEGSTTAAVFERQGAALSSALMVSSLEPLLSAKVSPIFLVGVLGS